MAPAGHTLAGTTCRNCNSALESQGLGGGIFSIYSDLQLQNNTIYGNSALIGGGLNIDNWSYPGLNNIFWANEADSFPEIKGPFILTYSDVLGGWDGEGNIDTDPLFVDPENGDFHPMFDSPCIDTGDPESPLDPDSTRADMEALYYDQHVGIEPIDNLPKEFYLVHNYPNPFNASTKISYELAQTGEITIDIYDILGRKVETLINRTQPAGKYSLVWNALGLPSGVYFYKLQAGDFSVSQKCPLLK